MRRILVVSDRADPHDPALARACRIAGENCADLDVVDVQRLAGDPADTGRHDRFLETIATARAEHSCIGTISVGTGGTTAKAIVAAAEAVKADLIVMRNTIDVNVRHDRPFELVERVVRRSGLPVLAVQNPAVAPYRRLIALTDRGRIAQHVLDLALGMKSATEIYAVHACEDGLTPGAEEQSREELAALVAANVARRPDVSAKLVPLTRRGDVATVLIRSWQELQPDLVVAVTHRRRGMRMLFGNSHVRELLEDMPFDLLIQEIATPHDGDVLCSHEPARSDTDTVSPHP
jgi:nucleotide-binding universal stress UspA family protein